MTPTAEHSPPEPPLPPTPGLCPMLTWGPSFGGCWPERGRAALGRQGLPKSSGFTGRRGQRPIYYIRAGHSGGCGLQAERQDWLRNMEMRASIQPRKSQ